MEITNMLSAFLGNFFFVFFLGIQMRFVMKGYTFSAMIASALISLAQVVSLTSTIGPNSSLVIIIFYVLGGSSGIAISILFNSFIEKLFNKLGSQ
jgi:uncharacterized protein YebE (UPF0316 family)